MILGQIVSEWLNELRGTQVGGWVILIFHSEKGCPTRQSSLASFDGDDATGVLSVFFQRIKIDAPDSILDITLVLKRERNGLWVTNDQYIIVNFLWISRARTRYLASTTL